jgi:hypothetical protein
MKNIKLSDADIAGMKLHYQEELEKTLRKLEHIKNTLEALGEAGIIEINVGKLSARKNAKPDENEQDASNENNEELAPQKEHKKRGPKSLWGTLVLKRMRQLDKPISYEDLTDEIMAFSKLPAEKRNATKQAIINVTFRLRNQEGKIDTVSSGSREKLLALRSWFESPGVLKKEYASKIDKKKRKTVAKKKKAKVAVKRMVDPNVIRTGKRGRPRKIKVVTADITEAQTPSAEAQA